MTGTLAVGVAAAILLKCIFLMARVSWPENYFDSTGRVSHWFLDSPFKVLLWRLIPYVLTSVAVSSVSTSIGANPTGSLWCFFVLHLLSTNGLSVAVALRKRVGHSGQFAYFLVVSAVLALITVLAAASPHLIVKITPSSEGVVEGVWTAIVVAILFTTFQSLTDHRSKELTKNIPFSNLNIAHYYIGYLASRAYLSSADLPLLVAITALESRNRPKLVRVAEALLHERLPRKWKPKSLGIAQRSAASVDPTTAGRRKPLREYDEESLESLAQAFAEVYPGPHAAKFGVFHVKALANKINQGTHNISNIVSVYEGLYSGPDAVMPLVHVNPVPVNIVETQSSEIEDLQADDGFELNAPWAVRFGEKVYLQFKVPSQSVESVEVQILDDSRSVMVLEGFRFRNNSREFSRGLYRLPAKGSGLRIVARLESGYGCPMPDLWYPTVGDVCTIDSTIG